MKKGLFLLALLAFTQNVKALEWDFTVAEGEPVEVEKVIAVQFNTNTNLWDYLLKGSTLRVYLHHLRDDIKTNAYEYELRGVLDEYNNDLGHYWAYTYKIVSREWHQSPLFVYNRWVSALNSIYKVPMPGPYYTLSEAQNPSTVNLGIINSFNIDEDENGDFIYIDMEDIQPISNQDLANDRPSYLQELTKSLTTSSFKSALLSSASIPINDVHITITNSQGQITSQFDTNIVFKLDQILQKVTRIQSDASTMVQELAFLINAFGFDGQPGSSTSNLAEFLGQWRTADGIFQGEVLNSLTNSVDYIDYLKYFITYGNPTNVNGLVWLYNQLAKGPTSWGMSYDGFLRRAQQNQLLGSSYVTAMHNFITDFRNQFYEENSSLSSSILSVMLRDMLWSQGVDWTRFQQTTNIINGIDIGRDWLTLATNDISSLPYWLNQQDYSSSPPIGVTNFQANTRWSVLTNQYAQIGLTGSGQQANSAETWNYFKRLEMLLAALVYKPEDEGEKLSNDMNSQSSDAETKKQDVKNSLDGLLSSFGGQKTLLQAQTSSFLSALARVNEMFDQTWTPKQWRYWKDDAEHGDSSSSGGASGSSVELWIDFSDSKYQFIFDYIRSLCGFLWSFFSLLVIYRFAILVHKLGMKVAKVAFSIFRHMFGS